MAGAALPGWHGKLPVLGDFTSRRLDPAFVEAWDGWLAAGLHALRARDAAGWLAAYLASPSWRFLLLPGAVPGLTGPLSRQAWVGVLMPSVDRVGRYFPFTLALPIAALPAAAPAMQRLWHWLARLDALAIDALQDDWTIDRVEQELARLGQLELDSRPEPLLSALPAVPAAGALVEWVLPDGAEVAAALEAVARAQWSTQSRELCFWYGSPEGQSPRLLMSRGLPSSATFSTLLGS